MMVVPSILEAPQPETESPLVEKPVGGTGPSGSENGGSFGSTGAKGTKTVWCLGLRLQGALTLLRTTSSARKLSTSPVANFANVLWLGFSRSSLCVTACCAALLSSCYWKK